METEWDKSKEPKVATDSGQNTDASSSDTPSTSSNPAKGQTKIKSPNVKSTTKFKFVGAVEEIAGHCLNLM